MQIKESHVLVIAGCLLTSVSAAIAIGVTEGTPTYDIPIKVIAGGGGTSTDGNGLSLSGTIGQLDATTQTLSGGAFTLDGGFWPAVAGGPGLIVLNVDSVMDHGGSDLELDLLSGGVVNESRDDDDNASNTTTDLAIVFMFNQPIDTIGGSFCNGFSFWRFSCY